VLGTVINVAIALAMGYVIFKVGFAVLGSMARPVPEPPPSGELRKVKVRYRCPSCGMELRVEQAADEDPMPPRHCMDEMELLPARDL
jgi:hypothetical protein